MLNVAAPTLRLLTFSSDRCSNRGPEKHRIVVMRHLPSFLQEGKGEKVSSLSRGDTFLCLPEGLFLKGAFFQGLTFL